MVCALVADALNIGAAAIASSSRSCNPSSSPCGNLLPDCPTAAHDATHVATTPPICDSVLVRSHGTCDKLSAVLGRAQMAAMSEAPQCRRDAECHHGICLRGRCDCSHIAGHGQLRWGGWNCTVDNGALTSERISRGAYSESTMDRWYQTTSLVANTTHAGHESMSGRGSTAEGESRSTATQLQCTRGRATR